jgi:Protein of unknown function (DUF3040)
MSLPAGQQRVLDAIEVRLRASEPQLISMFAIFTRLTRNDGGPHREQLPPSRPGMLRRLLILCPLVVVLAGLAVLMARDIGGAAAQCARTASAHVAVMSSRPAACPAQVGHGNTALTAK